MIGHYTFEIRGTMRKLPITVFIIFFDGNETGEEERGLIRKKIEYW
jgi:hypothetical protein